MPWTGSTRKRATSSRCSSCLERVEVVPGDALEVGQERPEALRPFGAAVGRERAEREPVEALGRARGHGCRPAAARPSLSAASTASVPELVNSTCSMRGGIRFRSSRPSRPGRRLTPSCTEPGVSSSSVSISAWRIRGLLRPALNIPKPPFMSRKRRPSASKMYGPSARLQRRSYPIVRSILMNCGLIVCA